MKATRLWRLGPEPWPVVLDLGSADVRGAALNPDGTRLVTIQADGTLGLWDAQDGRLLQKLNMTSPVPGDLFLRPARPRAPLEAMKSEDEAWIRQNRELVARMGWDPRELEDLARNQRRVTWVYQARDEERVHGPGLEITEQWTRQLSALRSAAAYSPHLRRLASMDTEDVVQVWDIESWQLLASFATHAGGPSVAEFSPDAAVLAIGSPRGAVELWEVAKGRLLASLDGSAQPVVSVAFSLDGTRLAAASRDRTARIWDVRPETRSPQEIARLVSCDAPWHLEQERLVAGAVEPGDCQEAPSGP